ncbi:MAG: TIGR00159 family protein [Flavobacteriales bacterium]|nr:TIGR00159 family protein [Flavobacteriales bacterium]
MDQFNFLNIGFLDILDIVLVAVLLFYIFRLIRGTAAINIFIGIAIIYLIWKLTQALEMELLSDILGKFLGGGFIALIIVFQQEIRKFLLMVGSTNIASKKGFLKHLKFFKTDIVANNHIDEIVKFCEEMGKLKTGVLIVLKRNNSLEFVKMTGDSMQIKVNKPILKSIFYKNSPLHDGAIVVENELITATRVILPIENTVEIPAHFGLRHRAGLGITIRTDALALIVSEESGQVSYFNNGAFILYEDFGELAEIIKDDLS